MTQHPETVFIIAGEASGDRLGASLAQHLMAQQPQLKLVGMGGEQMRAAGVDVQIDYQQLAVVGFVEVITHLPAIHQAMKTLIKLLHSKRPTLVILIDYPGFNLRFAKQAKQAGCKVMYYVSPQLWAWHYSRIHKIKRYIDHMAVLFPFEKTLYEKEHVPVSFVGHPLVRAVKPTLSKAAAYEHFKLDAKRPIIALMPGSRRQEVERLLPVMLAAIPLIQSVITNAQFVWPVAPGLPKSAIPTEAAKQVRLIEHGGYELMQLYSAAMVASGSATLELALHKIPMVIAYKVTPLSYWIGKRLIKVKHIGLCNLVSEAPVARELIQQDATANNLATEVIALIGNSPLRQRTLTQLAAIQQQLQSDGDSAENAARVAQQLLKQTSA